MLTLVGAGAVGVTLATQLSAAGVPLKLYVRAKDEAGFAAAGGLKLDRPRATSLAAPLPALTRQLVDDDTRYLIVATKFGALDALLGELADAPRHLTVISTLNGVRALPLIRQRLPQCRATALTIMFNAQHSGVLHAELTTKPAVILARAGGVRDDTLLSLLQRTGLQVSESRDEEACWGKLLINLANAIGALTHSTFRDLLSEADLRAIFVATLDEAVGCIEAAGIAYQLPMPLPYRGYRLLLKYSGTLTWTLAKARNGLSDGAYPSMVSDIRAGRTTEVQQLNGEIVALGAQLGRPTPINSTLVQLVEALDPNHPQRLTPAALRNRLLG